VKLEVGCFLHPDYSFVRFWVKTRTRLFVVFEEAEIEVEAQMTGFNFVILAPYDFQVFLHILEEYLSLHKE